MLIGGIALGLVLGLVLGGKLERLADIRLQYLPLLFLAVIIRFGTEALLGFGVEIVDTLRMPLLGAAYGLLLFTLWHNRTYPGLALAFIGIASNGLVILVNGGRMPVWMDAYRLSGLTGDAQLGPPHPARDAGRRVLPPPRAARGHHPAPAPAVPERRLDRRPVPHRGPRLLPVRDAPAHARGVDSRRSIEAREGHLLGVSGTARLRAPGAHPAGDRGHGPPRRSRRAPASARPSRSTAGSAAARSASARAARAWRHPPWPCSPRPRSRAPAATAVSTARRATPVRARRVRRHPYVRLALNGSFSALWFGQLISLFGDRVNQIALLFFVVRVDEVAARGRAHVRRVATCRTCCSPRSPVPSWTAGSTSEVLVVSDILRARSCSSIPVAISINIWLAYPIVFLITTVSLFFRPARVSILPRLVRRGRPAVGQLGDVGRRDDRRRHQLPARRPVRAVPRQPRWRSRSGSMP